MIKLRNEFNGLQKRPIKILFGYVAGNASPTTHRYDHWITFHTTKMVKTTPKIKVKSFFNGPENKMVPLGKDVTISREDCKIIVYVTISPQKGGVIFDSKDNLGK